MAHAPAHAEDGEGPEGRRGHGAHADEAVHVGRAAKQVGKAVDVVLAVQIHDRQDEQELCEGEGNGIFRAVEYC